jgi:hypothetical protein
MVGGATYEEARHIAQINASTAGIRVVYGGTTVHNSVSFLNEIQDAFYRLPSSVSTGARPPRFGKSRNEY